MTDDVDPSHQRRNLMLHALNDAAIKGLDLKAFSVELVDKDGTFHEVGCPNIVFYSSTLISKLTLDELLVGNKISICCIGAVDMKAADNPAAVIRLGTFVSRIQKTLNNLNSSYRPSWDMEFDTLESLEEAYLKFGELDEWNCFIDSRFAEFNRWLSSLPLGLPPNIEQLTQRYKDSLSLFLKKDPAEAYFYLIRRSESSHYFFRAAESLLGFLAESGFSEQIDRLMRSLAEKELAETPKILIKGSVKESKVLLSPPKFLLLEMVKSHNLETSKVLAVTPLLLFMAEKFDLVEIEANFIESATLERELTREEMMTVDTFVSSDMTLAEAVNSVSHL